jgi:hypothetical protein
LPLVHSATPSSTWHRDAGASMNATPNGLVITACCDSVMGCEKKRGYTCIRNYIKPTHERAGLANHHHNRGMMLQ